MATLTEEELEKLAKKNLGIEDASVAKVNAAARLGALPGVGAYGSTPETDQTNLNVAAAMSRGDLGNRFGFGSPQYQQGTEAPVVPEAQPSQIDIEAVNQRRNMILNGVDPDAPALVPNAKRKAQMYDELGTLTSVAHAHSLEQAGAAHQTLLQTKNIEASNQFANFVTGLAGTKHPIGTPEHVQEVAELASGNLAGVLTKAGMDILSTHMGQHKAAEQLQLAKAAHLNVLSGGKAKPEQVNKLAQATEADLIKKHQITPEQLLNPVSVKAGKIEGDKFTNAYPEAAQGDQIQLDLGEYKVNMTRGEYNHYKDVFSKAQKVTTASQETPVATPATEIISKNGHRYEVDHASKRVLRQID